MKKYGLRVLVGVIAFAIGVSSVIFWMFSERVPSCKRGSSKEIEFLISQEKELNSVDKAKSGKIEISFKQFIQTKDGNAVQFNVLNNTNETISYGSYQLKDEDLVMFPLYEIKINRNKIDSMWCGTGLMTYQLKPGESKVFQIYIRGLVYPWKKGKDLQVGFHFSKGLEKEYKIIWSENLPINGEIEKLFVKEKVELEKLTR